MPNSTTLEAPAVSRGEAAVRIGGLDHVVLRVGDLDRAISFYQKVLGSTSSANCNSRGWCSCAPARR